MFFGLLNLITKKYGTPKLFLGLLKCDGTPKLTGDPKLELSQKDHLTAIKKDQFNYL